MQPTYQQFPEVKARHHLVLDRPLFSIPEADGGSANMSPSTGWLGALLRHHKDCTYTCRRYIGQECSHHLTAAGASFAAECSRRIGAELHVFGYNWNAAHADMHSISTEEALFRTAEQNGEIIIHPTGKQLLLGS